MKTLSTPLAAHIAGEMADIATRVYRLWLLHKATGFDFVGALARGRTLFVGEGNFSFALSLARMPKAIPRQLIVTTFEKSDNLCADTLINAEILRFMGATVLYGVDATNLSRAFGSWHFDNIIFQFPHVGSREIVEGHNPNFILIRDFLLSANTQLNRDGVVVISAVDSPHYRGAFQFEDAANIAGLKSPEIYPFDPNKFKGYTHVMTHQNGSALENHNSFSTWVFRK